MQQHQLKTEADLPLNLPEKHFQEELDHRFDRYLDTVCAPIKDALGEVSDAELRKEMRDHLHSMVEANIELGDTLEQAVSHSLEQFGRTRSLQREWRKTDRSGTMMRKPLMSALFNQGLTLSIAMTIVPVLINRAQISGSNTAATFTDIGNYLLPAFAGVLTGLTARRRPVVATAIAISLLTVPAAIFDGWTTNSLGPSMWVVGVVAQAAISLMCRLPAACIGAVTGSLIRRLLATSKRHLSVTC